jgi:hypothetical protein
MVFGFFFTFSEELHSLHCPCPWSLLRLDQGHEQTEVHALGYTHRASTVQMGKLRAQKGSDLPQSPYPVSSSYTCDYLEAV